MPPWHDMTALALGAEIERGTADPRDLAAHFGGRIAEADPGRQIYVRLTPERMASEAAAARDRQQRGLRRSPLDGVPVSYKDLFDLAGEVTGAGSALLDGNVARRDAPVVARLSRAGLVSLGKTAMPEFAFSGLGVNPVRGTPPYPFDPETPRAPGGSSSGAAVSVAAGLAAAALGTDTGGSVRIPAAWNGLVGLKTTAGFISTEGVAPLSRIYDSIGPLTRDVADAAALFALLTAQRPPDLQGMRLQDVQVLAPTNAPVTEVGPPVRDAFEHAVERLALAGCKVRRAPVAALADAHRLLTELGNPVTAEAQAEWGELVRRAPDKVFAPIRSRIAEGEGMSAETYARLCFGLDEASRRLQAEMAGCGALLMPAVTIVPPPLGPLLDDPAVHAAANLGALKLTRLANFLKLTAITIPAGRTPAAAGSPPLPFGMMLMAGAGGERRLLRLASTLEKLAAEC
jgi:aspartyl-tRNA(Asn)/glutamyl-tRNA(Gln) amidotransferase subunit A